MPPKKRPRLPSQPPSGTPQLDPSQSSTNTPTSSTESAPIPKPGTDDYDPVTDPWTDEQETALLKGIVKWKPVGLHKHFRMIAISEFLKSQGYAPPNAEHTRIPGIWKKLGTLYNLQALDEREDSLLIEQYEEPDTSKELYCPFELPEDEYGDMMFERRLAAEGSSVATSGPTDSRRGSIAVETDEPTSSSPAPSRGQKNTRSMRTRGTRSSRLQVEIDTRRKESDEDQHSEDADANDDGDEEDTDGSKEDSGGDEEADEGHGQSPTTRGRSRRSRSRMKTRKGVGKGVRRTNRRR